MLVLTFFAISYKQLKAVAISTVKYYGDMMNVNIGDPWRIQVARVQSQVFTENDDLLRSIAVTWACNGRETVRG